jgi:hypothetical protein
MYHINLWSRCSCRNGSSRISSHATCQAEDNGQTPWNSKVSCSNFMVFSLAAACPQGTGVGTCGEQFWKELLREAARKRGVIWRSWGFKSGLKRILRERTGRKTCPFLV